MSKNDLDCQTKIDHCGCGPVGQASDPEKGTPEEKVQGEKAVLNIPKMDCPTEEGLIRGKLGSTKGVLGLEFNLLQRQLTVSHTPNSLQNVLQALREIGFESYIRQTEASEPDETPDHTRSHRKWFLLGISGLAALAAELADWARPEGTPLIFFLSILAIATGGLETYKKGWIAIKNRNLNMNALMSVAATGALLIGQWPEAAMVIFLFALAELIEALSLERARSSIRNLMAMAPETAKVKQADGAWLETDSRQVEVGAIVVLRPGERVALDGAVVSGQSTVNQAPITGESLPIEKGIGSTLYAGTINQGGELQYRVTAKANNSTLARVIHLVESAQNSRAPTQRFVDRFARVYTPIVFVVALAVALAPPLLAGGNWLEWIYRGLVLLVIACPCALVISTPVTFVSGLTSAARRGILIKGGAYLELGRKLRAIALDKTGTVTRGEPEVTVLASVDSRTSDRALQLAASLAARSDHPLSQALVRYAKGKVKEADVAAFHSLPGKGVKGQIQGKWFFMGNHRLVEDLGICSPDLEKKVEQLEQKGQTVTLVMDETSVLGYVAFADTVRTSSRAAIEALHALGVKTVMLTGDNKLTALRIASEVGIEDVRAELLPEDKLNAIEDLTTHTGPTGMVGDGINDAPALAKAAIGFAMGAVGSDIALETADVALMDDELGKIAEFIKLSRRTSTVLMQNIVMALGIKGIFILLAFTGHTSMWAAIFADMGTSLLVVFNGLRLLRS